MKANVKLRGQPGDTQHTLAPNRSDAALARSPLQHQARQAYQSEQLLRLIQHAYETCPYYTRLFKRLNLSPKMITDRSDLQRLPLLGRQTVRQHFNDLCSDRTDIAGAHLHRTAGSTGEPVQILWDKATHRYWQRALLTIVHDYGVQLTHFLPFQSGLIFVTAFPDNRSYSRPLPHFNYAYGRRLNIHPTHWRSPLETIKFIHQHQPVLLSGLPEHLLFLQQLALEADPTRQYPLAPQLVLSGGNTLSQTNKTRLETYFQAPVVDCYVSQEFGFIGRACSSGYHLDDSLIVEMIKPDGSPAPPSESGEIVITSLRNFSMPLIRYRIGDRGQLATTPCACPTPTPRLDRLEGRDNQFFIKADGTLMHPFTFIKHLNQLPLFQYQVIQQDTATVVVKYVGDQTAASIGSQISSCIHQAVGPITIRLERVTHLGEPGQKIQNFISFVPTSNND
ncbi:MAG: phenylacetate--CoA ligase family protein [Anaerolineae bacterium]|nr:phenylacetate--CoA ligase family protein [Anaerolineae bacterium]